MKILKQPWFLLLLLVASIYTYQFYQSPKSFQVSTNQALATSNSAPADASAVPEKEIKRVRVQASQSFPVSRFKNFEFATYRNMKIKFASTDSKDLLISLIGEGTGFKNEGKELSDWFDVGVKGKTLFVRSPNKKDYEGLASLKELAKKMVGDENPSLTMIVEFPENFEFKKLSLQGVSSDIDATGVAFRSLKIASVSGTLSFLKSKGREVEVEVVSGDNTLEVSGLQKASFASVSGDTKLISQNSTPKVKFESVSGDLDLKLPSDGQVDVNFESMTGDLSNDFGASKNKGSHIEFSSLSGDASITKIK